MPTEQPRTDKPSMGQITLSILAAFVGIQNNDNHEVDSANIERTGFLPYMIVGVLMTALFVALIYGLVQLIVAGS